MTLRQPLVGTPDPVTHTGFILAEDEALHSYLTGIKVPLEPGGDLTDVGVWFRWPQGERRIKYPFITIDLLEAAPAFDLWTSEYRMDPKGLYQPSVAPSLPSPDPNMNLDIRNYLAFRLTYQISVHARSAMHDRYLWSRFITDVFPPRPFFVGVDADNTWRRTELIDTTNADLMETAESGNKRTFRKVYTITMLAEIPQDVIRQQWQVLQTLISVVDLPYMQEYLAEVLYDGNEANLDPLSIPQEERESHGEFIAYQNISKNITPQTAQAATVAADATAS